MLKTGNNACCRQVRLKRGFETCLISKPEKFNLQTGISNLGIPNSISTLSFGWDIVLLRFDQEVRPQKLADLEDILTGSTIKFKVVLIDLICGSWMNSGYLSNNVKSGATDAMVYTC